MKHERLESLMEARYTTFAAAIGWAVSCLLMLFPASAQGEPIDVGGHKQLFVDGRFIAASEGDVLHDASRHSIDLEP